MHPFVAIAFNVCFSYVQQCAMCTLGKVLCRVAFEVKLSVSLLFSTTQSVMACVNVWRDWNVFPPDRCEALENLFQRGAFQNHEGEDDDDDIDGT